MVADSEASRDTESDTRRRTKKSRTSAKDSSSKDKQTDRDYEHDDGDDTNHSSMTSSLQHRYDRLLGLRTTDAERALSEYIKSTEKELSARKKACEFYKSECEALRQELSNKPAQTVEDNSNDDKARIEELNQTIAKLKKQIQSQQKTKQTPTNAMDAIAETYEVTSSGPATQTQSTTTGDVPQQVTETNTDSDKTISVNRTEANEEQDTQHTTIPTEPIKHPEMNQSESHENSTNNMVDSTKLKLLQKFTGIVDIQPTKDSEGVDGFACTIENSTHDRKVKFILSSDIENELSYEPSEVVLPNAPTDAFFREGLDFAESSAPVLHRELLVYVYDKGTETVSTAKKPRRSLAKS